MTGDPVPTILRQLTHSLGLADLGWYERERLLEPVRQVLQASLDQATEDGAEAGLADGWEGGVASARDQAVDCCAGFGPIGVTIADTIRAEVR